MHRPRFDPQSVLVALVAVVSVAATLVALRADPVLIYALSVAVTALAILLARDDGPSDAD